MSTLFSRRRALQAFSAIAGATAWGCGAPEEEEDAEIAEDNLNICIGRMDRAVRELGGAQQLHKYEKFVVLVMENRSFDHYFGHLSMPRELGGEGRPKWDGVTPDPEGKRVDGFTGNESNPDFNGNLVKIFRPNGDYSIGDIAHEWEDCHLQFADGRMNGFVTQHQADLERLNDGIDETVARCFGTKTRDPDGQAYCGKVSDPMAYYTRQDTKICHSLFDNYAICDRWFSSVCGPTWPNRFYIHGANAFGIKGNKPAWNQGENTIWGALRKKCLSARTYYADVPWIDGAYPGGVVGRTINTARVFENQPLAPVQGRTSIRLPEFARRALDYNTFEKDCIEGTLPTVSIIDPGFSSVPTDDHPPHDVQAGQTFVAAIYKMLTMNEDQWKKTLFLITYDEHGSFYDHVKPGVVQEDERAEFRQLGFRVPTLVIGPHVKKNYVSHVQYDHSSIAATITRRFNLDPLNDRVRRANSIEDCIDWDSLSRQPNAPAVLPQTLVNERQAHESIEESHGQEKLNEVLLGGQPSREARKIQTDKFLEAADRLGVARIR